MTSPIRLRLQRIAARIDALSLRERAIAFVMSAVLMLMLLNQLVLDPEFKRQKQLTAQLEQDQAKIAKLQQDIQQKAAQQNFDPDAINRARLQALADESAQIQASLIGVQNGLVTPNAMPALLETMLRRGGKLRLVALNSLPVASLDEPFVSPAKAERSEPAPTLDGKKILDKLNERAPEKPAEKSAESTPEKSSAKAPASVGIFRHGVEMKFEGNYLDMLAYLTELEKLPTQLFWANARFEVIEYPKASLTITVFTLSLDKKWLKI